jgi:hypothetical protein
VADQPSSKGACPKKVRQNAAAFDQQLIEKQDEWYNPPKNEKRVVTPNTANP